MVTDSAANVLVIGYGNPGRLDDGLGPAFAAALDSEELDGVTVDSNYQLSIEDAEAIANHSAVIFADAALEGREPFYFERLEPETPSSFTSHSVDPRAVLSLTRDMFHANTPGYVLGIRGYEFNEFGESLSEAALANLAEALAFIKPLLKSGSFEDALTG